MAAWPSLLTLPSTEATNSSVYPHSDGTDARELNAVTRDAIVAYSLRTS